MILKQINVAVLLGLLACQCWPENLGAMSLFNRFRNKSKEVATTILHHTPAYMVMDKAQTVWSNAIKKSLGDYPHRNEVALVRTGSTLPEGEQTAIAARKKHNYEALKKMLGTNLNPNECPSIAFCCSGGGYRAMIATLGFLMGAEEIGLLDATTYMSALSGSTWLLAPWLYRNISLQAYRDQLIPKVQKSLVKTSFNKSDLFKMYTTKMAFGQPTSSIDLWGALIINTLAKDLGSSGQKLRLSELAPRVEKGQHLFPIFTSALPCKGNKYEWLEFTPHEVGSPFLGGYYIPTWSFGRRFEKGSSIDNAPEQTMGYGLGIFGSAFAVSIADAKKELPNIIPSHIFDLGEKLIPSATADWMAKHKSIDEKRFSPAIVHNFVYGIGGAQKSDEPVLTCVDGGLAFNLPFPPLLRPERGINIIVVCDASQTVKDAPALHGAEEYALRKGLKFPRINYEGIETRTMTVFKDETDRTVPVVIYIPWIRSNVYKHKEPKEADDYCKTTNFAYKPEQLETLRKAMTDAVVSNKDNIVHEIRTFIETRRPIGH